MTLSDKLRAAMASHKYYEGNGDTEVYSADIKPLLDAVIECVEAVSEQRRLWTDEAEGYPLSNNILEALAQVVELLVEG